MKIFPALIIAWVLAAVGWTQAGWAQNLSEDLIQKGMDSLIMRQYGEAVKALQSVVTRDPKDAFAWAFLGNAQNRLGKYVKAEGSLRKALELEPQWRGLNYDLGLSLYHRNKIEEALRCFRTALEANPKSANVHWMLGLALLRKKEFAEARSHLGRAAGLAPERYLQSAQTLLERLAREVQP